LPDSVLGTAPPSTTTAPAGKTRKSAAAAKPKRANAGTGSTSKSGKSSKATTKKREPMVYHPQTAEYTKWRRIWWGCLGSAVVLTTISWFVMRSGAQYQTIGSVLLGLGYASIAAALYLDWTKLRKLRAQWVESGQAAEAGKAAEKEREAKAAQKAAASAKESGSDDGSTADKS